MTTDSPQSNRNLSLAWSADRGHYLREDTVVREVLPQMAAANVHLGWSAGLGEFLRLQEGTENMAIGPPTCSPLDK